MRPLRLEIAGFQSFREPTTVSLDGIGRAAIVGPNRAGKTSLIEAIAWALYGRGRAAGADSVVSHGAADCRVRFEFELGGYGYAVERQRERTRAGKSSLELQAQTIDAMQAWQGETVVTETSWHPAGGDSIAETQAAIVRLVGMDFETWSLTSWIGQGRADAFTRLRPAERKDLLSDVLGLGLWDELHDRAKAIRLRLAGEITATERALSAADQWLTATEAPDIDTLKADVDAAGARLSAADERVKAAERELASAARREELEATLVVGRGVLERKRVEAEEAHEHRRKAAGFAELAADAEGKVAAITGQILESSPGAVEAAIAAADAEIDALTAAADALTSDGGTCPTCGQELTEAGRKDRAAELMLEIAALAEARHEATVALEAARSHAQDLRTALALWQERALAERGKAGDAEGKAKVAERIASVEIPEIEARQAQTQAEIARLGARGDPETFRAELAAAEARRQECAADERAAIGALAAAERLAAQIAETTSLREQTSAAVAGLTERHSLLTTAERAFGRGGIPARLIEAAVPEIEAEANRLLAGMMGELSVTLETVKATKTAGNRETLEIMLADAGEERPIEQLSGAERQSVDLALRIGLSLMLARRSDAAVEMLVIDEGATAFDAEHRQAIPRIIGGLEAFSTVLFVTHLVDLAESFPAKILVSRPAGTTVVEVRRGGE